MDFSTIRAAIVSGIHSYLNIPIIRSNQIGKIPSYPYGSYTVLSIADKNGTYGIYDDEYHREPMTHTWSFSFQSDDIDECIDTAINAKSWFDHVGTVYLSDNNIIVQSIGSVTNRDNLITLEYEHRAGFDVTFWGLVESSVPDNGIIEIVEYQYDINT